jgi:hypothetical protein
LFKEQSSKEVDGGWTKGCPLQYVGSCWIHLFTDGTGLRTLDGSWPTSGCCCSIEKGLPSMIERFSFSMSWISAIGTAFFQFDAWVLRVVNAVRASPLMV